MQDNKRMLKLITRKELACIHLHEEIVEYVFGILYREEKARFTNPKRIFFILNVLGKHDLDCLEDNLAFICSKLGCQSEADLAEALEVSEDEIYDLEDKTDIAVDDLAAYWEHLADNS